MPLGAACTRGCLDAVKVLVEHGADVKITKTDGSTALCLAIKHDHIDIVQYLLENTDIDIELKNQVGETPLLKVQGERPRSQRIVKGD
jgi:ankyrin repeat protein